MEIKALNHYNIVGTTELIENVRAFYMDILDFTIGDRPDFSFDGYWLYQSDHPLIHLSVAAQDPSPTSTGHMSHVAFTCTGAQEMLNRLIAHEVDYKLYFLDEIHCVQIFITDPAKILVELNYVGETHPTEKR